jgi:hypothetical protein
MNCIHCCMLHSCCMFHRSNITISINTFIYTYMYVSIYIYRVRFDGTVPWQLYPRPRFAAAALTDCDGTTFSPYVSTIAMRQFCGALAVAGRLLVVRAIGGHGRCCHGQTVTPMLSASRLTGSIAEDPTRRTHPLLTSPLTSLRTRIRLTM